MGNKIVVTKQKDYSKGIESISYLDDDMNPVDQDKATLVEITYIDGSVVFAVPEKNMPVVVTI